MGLGGRLFICGLGYTAKVIARDLATDGWQVAGTTRTAESRAKLMAAGFEAYVHGPDAPLDPETPALRDATHLLATAAPDAGGDPFLAAFGRAIDGRAGLVWTGYLSTTGVYGDLGGGEADETTPLKPTSERSHRRVLAERQWQAIRPAAHVFRLPGIYGPGRNALQQIVDGRARRILKPGHRFSRIHVDDISQAVRAAMARPTPGAVTNVIDDLPAESADVLAYAALLLGRPVPKGVPFAEAELSTMAKSFYDDNKTVSNARMKRELGIALRYPTYRQGLQALLADYSAG